MSKTEYFCPHIVIVTNIFRVCPLLLRVISLHFSLCVLTLWRQWFDWSKFYVTFGAASFDLCVFNLASAIKTVKTLFSSLSTSSGTHGTFVFVKFAIVIIQRVLPSQKRCVDAKTTLLRNNYHGIYDQIETIATRTRGKCLACHTYTLVTRPNINHSWGRRPWRESDRCRPPVGMHEQRPFDIHIGAFGLAGGRGRQPSVSLLRLLFDFFPLLLLLQCYRYYLLYFGRTCSRHAIHSLIELNIMTLITPCRSLSIESPGLPVPPRFASSFRFRLIFFRANPRRRQRFWTRTCFVYLVRCPIYAWSTFTATR